MEDTDSTTSKHVTYRDDSLNSRRKQVTVKFVCRRLIRRGQIEFSRNPREGVDEAEVRGLTCSNG